MVYTRADKISKTLKYISSQTRQVLDRDNSQQLIFYLELFLKLLYIHSLKISESSLKRTLEKKHMFRDINDIYVPIVLKNCAFIKMWTYILIYFKLILKHELLTQLYELFCSSESEYRLNIII